MTRKNSSTIFNRKDNEFFQRWENYCANSYWGKRHLILFPLRTYFFFPTRLLLLSFCIFKKIILKTVDSLICPRAWNHWTSMNFSLIILYHYYIRWQFCLWREDKKMVCRELHLRGPAATSDSRRVNSNLTFTCVCITYTIRRQKLNHAHVVIYYTPQQLPRK